MPALIAFRRRWAIGSDDFVFPALIDFGIHIACFIIIITLFLLNKREFSCPGPQYLNIFIKSLLVLLGATIILNAAIAYVSACGTITQVQPRHYLPLLLYSRILLGFPQIILNGFGSKWAFTQEDHACESSFVVLLVQIIVIGSWSLLLIIIGKILIVFDPLGAVKIYGNGGKVRDIDRNDPQALYINLNSTEVEKSRQIWEFRMKVLCCCTDVNPKEHSKNAYSEIAQLFSSYFQDVDLVPSDVVAGLILLHEKQMAERVSRTSTSQHSETFSAQSPDSLTSTGAVQGSIISSPDVFTPPAQQFWMTMEMACHFMKYAYASYGWPLYVYVNCCAGLYHLWNQIRCMSCCRKKPSYIIDDNCCECHTAALKKITGLTEEDLVYVSFHNKVYEVPFYVAIDHQTCSVVVSIRGTLSLPDILTDLTAECETLSEHDRSNGIFCHRGMLLAANYVKRKLEETNLLNEVFSVLQSYSLVITGHSLGAGTASVLALLLRSKYPTLKCFAFSPPGGLLNVDGVKHSEDFIFSIVVGDDLVPRLSVPTMEDMKKNILNCIIECDQPKYKVLLGILCNKNYNSDSEMAQRQVSRPLLPDHINTESYDSTNIQERNSLMKNNAICSNKLSAMPLFLPGRILHLTEVNGSYRAKWVSAEYFNQIIISPNMIHDHMPNIVYKSLLQLTRNRNQFLP